MKQSIKDSIKSSDSVDSSDFNVMDCHDLTKSSLAMTAKDASADSPKSSKVKRLFNAIFTPYNELDFKDYKTYRDISIFAIINICFLICVFSPFALYSSDVTQFDSTQRVQTLSALFGIFLLSSFLIIYITSFFYKTRLLKIGVFGFSVIALMNISYAFLFMRNIFTGRPYAQIDGLLFQDGGAGISSVWAKYFDIGYGFLMMFVALLLLWFGKRYFRYGLLFLLVVMLLSSGVDSIKIFIAHESSKPKEAKIQDSKNTQAFRIPSELSPYLDFSKDKNILVIFSDTVQSDNFTQALKDYPQIFDDFSGFTYYTNTLSVGSITFASAPAISGGSYYSPVEINKRDSNLSLAAQSTQAIADVANAFEKSGYKVALGTSYPSNDALLAKALNKGIFVFPDNQNHIWRDFYAERIDLKQDDISHKPIGELFSYGLFSASPYIFRARIYLSGGWLFGDSLHSNHLQGKVYHAGRLLAFSQNLTTDSTKPTFKLLYEAMEHFPWMLRYENDCKPIESVSEYRSKTLSDRDDLAYQNHLCYVKHLSTFLNALKEAKIYDNTKIIIVSDHGNGGNGAPIIDFPMRAARNSHIFFMVKDFNSTGKLKIDKETFISNADTMAIACDEIESKCPNIAPSVLKVPVKNRELFYSIVDGGTGREANNRYDINIIYKVKDNIFDLKNWEQVK